MILSIFLAAGALAAIGYVTHGLRRRLKTPAYGLVAYNSLTSGPHGSGRITRTADAAFTSRYLIAKPGATDSGMAIGDASTMPLGVVLDEPGKDEPGTLALFGNHPGTLPVRIGAAVSADDEVIVTANGKAIKLPAANGTYYVIGRALDDGAGDADKIEIQHCYPRKVVISG